MGPPGAASESDDGRPRFHLTPHAGWINDPHGILHRDGEYHVFTQWVPDDVRWRTGIHWGHAVGPDLMRLRDTGAAAIAPGDGDDGIWTGCIVDDGTTTRAFYTAVTAGDLAQARVRTASAEDRAMTRWRKGPVVVEPPPGVVAFRDPVVFRDGDRWWMTVGAELDGRRAAALAWCSTDLEQWEYRGVAAERSSSASDPWTGSLWECPQLVRLDDGDVLVASVWEDSVSYDTAWATGTWVDGRFDGQEWRPLTTGGVHYAPSTFVDACGRPSVLFWLRGVSDPEGSWAGALSIPYRIVREDGEIRLRLHPDVARHSGSIAGSAETDGPALVVWDPKPGDELRVDLGGDALALVTEQGRLRVRRAADPDLIVPRGSGAVDLVVDGPVVEVLADRGLGGVVLDAPARGVRIAPNEAVTVRPLVV